MTLTLCTPCHDGMYHTNYCEWLVALGSKGGWGLLKSEYESDIVRHRSRLASQWLTDPKFAKATHLLFIDADVGPGAQGPSVYLDRMARHPDDMDVVAGVYVKKDGNQVPLFRGLTETRHPSDPNIVEAEAVPTGFTRYSRRVLQAVYDSKRHEHWNDWRLVYHARIMQSSIGWRYESEDYAFCLDARALGHKVWLDRAIRLTHRGHRAYAA